MGCSPWGREESDTTEQLHFHFSLLCIGEGNGNPLQCSCLENPRDGGASWAAVYGVAQSRTRLMRLSSSSSSSKGYFLVTLGFPRWHRVEESSCIGRRIHEMWVQSLGWERSPGVGNDNPLQDSCLEVSKDRVAWQITVHGATELNTIERLHTYTHNLINESWNVTKCAIHQWKWPQTLIVSFAKKSGCQQIFSNVVKFLPCVHICRWLEFHNLGEAFSVFHQHYPKLTMVFSLLMTLLLLLNISFHWALTLSI